MIGPLSPRDLARVRSVLFVARCTAATILSYVVAGALGLAHPVWAIVSALIVSQDTVGETRKSFLWRAVGTVTGASIAVAICAAIARRWPLMRVCLWTAPLVILTATTEHSILHTAAQRSGEVLLGGLIGAAIHLLVDRAIVRWLANDRDDHGPAAHVPRPSPPERPAAPTSG